LKKRCAKGKTHWRSGSYHVGPARSQQVLREALAKGADRAIHLEDNAFRRTRRIHTAKAFAALIKDEKFDLILHRPAIRRLTVTRNGSHPGGVWAGRTPPSSCRSKNRYRHSRGSATGGGIFSVCRHAVARVLTIQSGINKPPMPRLIGIKQAKKKLAAQGVLAEVAARHRRESAKRSSVCMFRRKPRRRSTSEGSASRSPRSWVDKLRNELRVL